LSTPRLGALAPRLPDRYRPCPTIGGDGLRHFALVLDPDRFRSNLGGEGYFAFYIVASGAEHLAVVDPVVTVRMVARDDVVDFDANPTGEATGPAAVALGADGVFGFAGEFVALGHVFISVVDVTNIGPPLAYVNGDKAFFSLFLHFFFAPDVHVLFSERRQLRIIRNYSQRMNSWLEDTDASHMARACSLSSARTHW